MFILLHSLWTLLQRPSPSLPRTSSSVCVPTLTYWPPTTHFHTLPASCSHTQPLASWSFAHYPSRPPSAVFVPSLGTTRFPCYQQLPPCTVLTFCPSYVTSWTTVPRLCLSVPPGNPQPRSPHLRGTYLAPSLRPVPFRDLLPPSPYFTHCTLPALPVGSFSLPLKATKCIRPGHQTAAPAVFSGKCTDHEFHALFPRPRLL